MKKYLPLLISLSISLVILYKNQKKENAKRVATDKKLDNRLENTFPASDATAKY